MADREPRHRNLHAQRPEYDKRDTPIFCDPLVLEPTEALLFVKVIKKNMTVSTEERNGRYELP